MLSWSVGLSDMLTRQRMLRTLIISTTLLLSGYAVPTLGVLVLFPVLAAGFIFSVARWPMVGLTIFIVGGMMVPFAIGTGSGTALNAAALLIAMLGGLWLLRMALGRQVRLRSSRVVIAMLAMSVVSIISFLLGLQKWLPLGQTAPVTAQVGGLSIFLLSFGAFLLMAHQVTELRWLERLTWVYVGVGTFYMLWRLAGTPIISSVPAGMDTSVLWTWVPAIAASQGLLNRSLPFKARAGLIALLSVTLFLGIRNWTWTSGWLPGVVAVAVIVWLGRPRLAALGTFIVAVALLSRWSTITGLLFGEKNQYDLLTRNAAWEILWKIIAVDPVLGTGFANYYHYTLLYPILGWSVKFNSHSNYIDLVAQTGFVGLAMFAWMMFEIVRLSFRLRNRVPEGFPKAYVVGAIGAIAGMLVSAYLGDWILPFTYNVGLNGLRASAYGWFFLGGLVVLENLFWSQTNTLRIESPNVHELLLPGRHKQLEAS